MRLHTRLPEAHESACERGFEFHDSFVSVTANSKCFSASACVGSVPMLSGFWRDGLRVCWSRRRFIAIIRML